jgi:hypothetical protein
MTLIETIMVAYPELKDEDFYPGTGSIQLQNDSDGLGDYIEKWEYSKPLPDGMKVGK